MCRHGAPERSLDDRFAARLRQPGRSLAADSRPSPGNRSALRVAADGHLQPLEALARPVEWQRDRGGVLLDALVLDARELLLRELAREVQRRRSLLRLD